MSLQTNTIRTAEYLKNFNRQITLEKLVNNKHPLIIDVGANIGQSVDEFKKFWPNSKIHCFEPQAKCLEKLESTASKYDDVFVNNYAVGSEKKDQIFYSHDISLGLSGFNKVNFSSKDSIDLSKVSSKDRDCFESKYNHESVVKVDRLDNYLSNNSIDNVDLLKIDTQGYEPEVIEGLGDSINNIKVIVTELMFYDFYDRSLSFYDIEKILLPKGFKLFDISHISKNPMNGRTDWVDVIYKNYLI